MSYPALELIQRSVVAQGAGPSFCALPVSL